MPRELRPDPAVPGLVLVVTWAPGGNVPPVLAAGALLAARGHPVRALASAATRPAAERAGFEVKGYRRSPDPVTRVAFERQAEKMMATAAGPAIAQDVCDALAETPTDLVIVDCMLPAALAAGKATRTPTTSLVHFLYGLARRGMLQRGGGWTTDLDSLNETQRRLGLPPAPDGLTAWEAVELLLVTAPRWLDVAVGASDHVIYAGPLGIRTGPPPRPAPAGTERPQVLLSFSTTVMDGQLAAMRRVCDAVADFGGRAIVTLGPAVDAAALRAPDAMQVATWADHDDLLPGCSAVITHGGLGTTLRALTHGVPLLLLPLGRDQAFNAARVTSLGAGIRLGPDAGRGEVRSALDRLLHDSRYAEAAAAVASRMAGDQPDRHAAEALEGCAEGGGR